MSQRLFDIAKIYGGTLMEMPVHKTVRRASSSAGSPKKPAPLSPPRKQPSVKTASAESPGKPGALGTTMMAVEQERLEILKRKARKPRPACASRRPSRRASGPSNCARGTRARVP